MTTIKPLLAALGTMLLAGGAAQAAAVSDQILIDQFGWRTDAQKIALFAQPVKGQNAAASGAYVPGARFEVHRVRDDRAVLSGPITAWRDGKVDATSGDRVWSGDLTALRTPGRYYVLDPKNGLRSSVFVIGDSVYTGVLRASLRMFYYQRCGLSLTPTHAGKWIHAACHIGLDQDRAARLFVGGKPQREPRDVSGGWHDAGDYNKYVSFTSSPLWDLMTAYELSPSAFGDRENIPESGNGVPDVLDEVKWELDWLLKMQRADGGVFNRVAEASYSNGPGGPDHDSQPQYYTPVTTWATASFAASAAHAARLFRAYGKRYPGYDRRLERAARNAWAYLDAHPQMLPADGTDGAGKLAAAGGDSTALNDLRLRVLAAAELFKTTGDRPFQTYFDAHYNDPDPIKGGGQPLTAGYLDPSGGIEPTEAYFAYATARGATPAVVEKLRGLFQDTAENTVAGPFQRGDDPYRAFMWDGHYCWGSNEIKAHWARLVVLADALNVRPDRHALYRQIAEEYLHYYHGRNPLSIVYLSNMGARGARLTSGRSVMDFYHGWFSQTPQYHGPASPDGPAPGYLVGGPNQFYTVAWVAPPHGEPPMKSFKDWSGGWNAEHGASENSWEVTEPAIYYQAAYTLLLSAFCAPPTKATH